MRARSGWSWEIQGDEEPWLVGVAAPIGYSYRNVRTGVVYQKVGPGDLGWIPLGFMGNSGEETFQLPNGSGQVMYPGQPVTSLNQQARFASAMSEAMAAVIGIVVVGAAQTLPVTINPVGPVTLSPAQWDVVTGGSGGLVPDATYFLDTTAGRITTTPPTSSGIFLVNLARALTAETLVIRLQPPLLL